MRRTRVWCFPTCGQLAYLSYHVIYIVVVGYGQCGVNVLKIVKIEIGCVASCVFLQVYCMARRFRLFRGLNSPYFSRYLMFCVGDFSCCGAPPPKTLKGVLERPNGCVCSHSHLRKILGFKCGFARILHYQNKVGVVCRPAYNTLDTIIKHEKPLYMSHHHIHHIISDDTDCHITSPHRTLYQQYQKSKETYQALRISVNISRCISRCLELKGGWSHIAPPCLLACLLARSILCLLMM